MNKLGFSVFLLLGCLGLLQSQWILLKAELAQKLIAHSWQTIPSTDNGAALKPWGWADFSALARLRWKDQDVFVLSSASGQALAFGPGHLPQSAAPGAPGRVIIAGHNDSHFAFLQQLSNGDDLSLENTSGTEIAYRITNIEIVDSRKTKLQNSTRDELVLVTCYPFNSLDVRSPLRLVVQAEVISNEMTIAQPSTVALEAELTKRREPS